MALAQACKNAPCELRADFQQYYGLNLDGMGEAYTLSHAACLCAQLPPESRTVRALLGDRAEEVLWTLPVRIAAEQLNTLRVIRWLKTKDAADGKNFPEPLLPPEVRNPEPTKPDADGYKAALAAIRERIIESREGDGTCLEQ